MTRWQVHASRPDGKTETLMIEAESDLMAAKAVRSKGLSPLLVKPAGAQKKQKPRGANTAAVRLVRELSALLGAGLTIEQALASLGKFTGNALIANVAADLLQSVRAGCSLSAAFSEHPEVFPPPFPQIAEAGESSGSLARSLADLASWQEQKQKFEAEIQGSLLYPVILLVLSSLAVIGLLIFVVPRFEQVFLDMQAAPPAFAGFVFGLSRSLFTWLPVLLGSGLLLFVIYSWWRRQPGSDLALYRTMHNLPLLGPFQKTVLAARFTRVLGVLLQNGLSTAPAFRLASEGLLDGYARHRLGTALDEVRRGGSLPEQLARADILPPLANEIMRVGEETGDLTAATQRLADLYEEQLTRNMQTGIRIAEPLLIGFVGLIIGAIVLSILLALVSINDIGL